MTGGCLCGAVRYEAEAYLNDAYYCHCRMCPRSSGTPAALAVYIVPGTLRYLAGRPRFYRSSELGQRGFCATCGSRLVWATADGSHPDWTSLDAGCLDEPARARPVAHNCVESRLPWFLPGAGLPQNRSDALPG